MALADTANLIIALNLRDGVSGGLGNLNRQLKGMEGGLSQVSRGIGSVGRGLDTIVTRGALAAGAGLAAVVTTAASFEQAFVGVEKTVDGTAAQLGELEEQLRGMTRIMPTSFEELAGIAEAGGALGIAREDLDEFVDVVARLGVSTDLSTDQAATALGKLGTILHLSGAEFEDLADSLVALGNAGGSTEAEIVEVAQRFAAAGNSAGLTKEEILALASATTSMGIDIEAAGSSLSRIFDNVATNIGTSSDKAEAFADTLNLSAAEFRKAWERDALGTFQDFLGELAKLDQFEQARVLEEIGITGVRDVNAVRLMTQNLGFFEDQLRTSANAQGALRTESDKFFATATSNFKELVNIGRDSLAIVGEEVLPEVNKGIGDLAAELNKPEVRAGLEAFGKDLAGGLREFIKEVKRADFGPLLDTMKGAAAIAKSAFDAFRSLPEPLQQLALAAVVGNKVTGGALFGIVGGLKDIALGTLKGLRTINAVNVTVIGRNVIGGGPGGVPAGGAGGKGGAGALGLLGTSAFWLVGAPILANELGKVINAAGLGNPLVDPRNPYAGTIYDPINPATGRPFTEPAPPRPGDTGDVVGADTILLREWGGKLDKLATSDVIRHLERTNEIGQKGIGNSFQVGLTNGLDPVGDIATQILARAEDPKAPQVMFETAGHLKSLEEIQAQYLAQGDVHLAELVQENIDTLHGVQGSVDLHRGVTEFLADQARSSDMAMLATAENQLNRLDIANTRLSAIENAPPPFVKVDVYTNISASIIHNQQTQIATVSGTRIPGVQTPF